MIDAPTTAAPEPRALLDECDRILGEIGRRRHLFSWLRAPGAAASEWLPVDAYYPRRRLVIVSHDGSGEHDQLYRELVPAHGLRLLELDANHLSGDRLLALRDKIEQLELPTPPVPSQSVGAANSRREGAISRLSASLAQATAPAPSSREASRVVRPLAGVAREPAAEVSAPTVALGLAVGVALSVALGVELFLGVGSLAMNHGRWLLAFGLALDACSRVLGTVAAGRSGEADWAWWSVLGGSPVVATFTLFGRDERLDTEPGPIAGLVSVLALAVIGLALLGALLNI